jgi:phosphatidylserine decarboxylase
MLKLVDFMINKFHLNADFSDYKRITTLIQEFVFNDAVCKAITKTMFPLVLPIYPVNYEIDKKLFIVENDEWDSYNSVFLRKYKHIEISKSPCVSPVDGLHIQTGKCINNCIYINDYKMCLKKVFHGNIRLSRRYHYDVLYLQYSDYHYVHFPIDCKVLSITNIPGKYKWMEPEIEFGCKFLGSNYRKIYTMLNEMTNKVHYLVMIASIIVGGINTIFYDESGQDYSEYYKIDLTSENVRTSKGDPLANFYIGSMVCHIYPSDINPEKPFSLDKIVRVGKEIEYKPLKN